MSWPTPLAGEGPRAGVVPLKADHHDELCDAVAEGGLHRIWYTPVPDPAGMQAEIARRLDLARSGLMHPFAILDRASGKAVGMTTYMNIDPASRRLEIGHTWLRRSCQGTGINADAKRQLLAHAFDACDAIAVEFRIHVLNHQSRAAVARLGARLDGILRSHKIMPNGTLRDTAVYSITAAEWPAVRADLDWRLDRGAP